MQILIHPNHETAKHILIITMISITFANAVLHVEGPLDEVWELWILPLDLEFDNRPTETFCQSGAQLLVAS